MIFTRSRLILRSLFAPHFQSKFLPDQLKSKYLDGQALLIVKEIHDLDEIWKRLEEAFGNVDLLLANKLRILVGTTPLFKILTTRNWSKVLLNSRTL